MHDSLARPMAGMAREYSRRADPVHRSDPDDIQIHIGRIEVTAVAPPSAKVAPKAQRKGETLDRYLMRRDGRA